MTLQIQIATGNSNTEQYDWKDAVDLTAQFTRNNIPGRVASDIMFTIQKILARHQFYIPLPNDSKTTKQNIANSVTSFLPILDNTELPFFD